MNIKKKAVDIIASIYSWFYKAKPTKQMLVFIESLVFVFLATGLSKGLLFVMNILGGRFLGAETYGEYTLINTFAMFLAIPIGLGVLGGVTRQLADVESFKRRKIIISTATNYFLITLVLFSAVYFLFYKELALVTKMGHNLFLLTALLVIFWSSNSLIESVFRGLHKQRQWSWITIISYALAFTSFAYLAIIGNINILLLFIPTFIIYAGFSFFGALFLRNYFTPGLFDSGEFKEMFHYGAYAFIITVAVTFLGNVDRVMINYFLGAGSVGLYQAYFFSSIMIIGVITGAFIRVFFPTAVKVKDPLNITKKLDRLMLIGIPAAFILLPFLIWFVVFLYGYEFSLLTAFLFSLATAIDILVVINSATLNAQGTASIKKTATGLVAAFIINIPLNYFLINLLGINGAIIATATSMLILYIYIRINLKKQKIT